MPPTVQPTIGPTSTIAPTSVGATAAPTAASCSGPVTLTATSGRGQTNAASAQYTVDTNCSWLVCPVGAASVRCALLRARACVEVCVCDTHVCVCERTCIHT